MKKFTFILFLSFILFSLSAQTNSSTDTIINFDLTLKKIVKLVESGNSNDIDMDQYIILDGIVSDRIILASDKENFVGRLEISYGEWEGLENVAIYKCLIQIQGLEFASMIPARRSRTPNPNEITLNTHLLILGKYLGYNEDDSGNKTPVIEGYKLRKIN